MAFVGRNRNIVITTWENLADQIQSKGQVYWKLYEGHHRRNNNVQPLDQSTMMEGLEMADSLEQLEAVLLRLGGGDGHVRVYEKANTGTGFTEYKFSILVDNGRFLSSPSMLPNTQGINGIGSQVGMIELQTNFMKQLHEKELAIIELKHQYEQERTEERIAALEDEMNNGTTMQKLLNTCSEFIQNNPSIIGAVLTNLMGGKGGQVAISGLPNSQQQNQQSVSNMKQNTGTQPQQKEVNAEEWNARLQLLLQKMQSLITTTYNRPWDVLDVLEAQAQFLEENKGLGKKMMNGLADYMPQNQNKA